MSGEPEVARRGWQGWARTHPYILLAAATLLIHGLIVFMTVVVGDDWLSLYGYAYRAWKPMWLESITLKVPLNMINSLPFALVGGNLVVLRVINLFLIGAVAALLFRWLEELLPRCRDVNLAAALVFISFPSYRVYFMVNYAFLLLSLGYFLAAGVLAFRGEKRVGAARAWRLTVAFLLVMLSFNFGALLLCYPFFLGAHYIIYRRRNGLPPLRAAAAFINQRLVFFFAPLVFWGIRDLTALTAATLEGYNDPRGQNLAAVAGAVGQFASVYSRDVALWAGAIPFAVALFIGLWWARRRPAPEASRRVLLAAAVVGFGVVLAGILPYILVGKSPIIEGDPRGQVPYAVFNFRYLGLIDSRMHLVSSVGWALGLTFLVAALASALRRNLVWPWALAAVAGGCAFHIQQYLDVERRWLPLESLRFQLKTDPQFERTKIYGIVDRTDNFSTYWDFWPFFFNSVWGTMDHFAIEEEWYSPQANRELVYDRDGIINRRFYGGAWVEVMTPPEFGAAQATLILSRGSKPATRWLAVKYFWARVFNPPAVPGMLRALTVVEYLPKENIEADLAGSWAGGNWSEATRPALAAAAYRGSSYCVTPPFTDYNLWQKQPFALRIGPRLAWDMNSPGPVVDQGRVPLVTANESNASPYICVELRTGGRLAATEDVHLRRYIFLRDSQGQPLPVWRKFEEGHVLLYTQLPRRETSVEIVHDSEGFDARVGGVTAVQVWRAPAEFKPEVYSDLDPVEAPEGAFPSVYEGTFAASRTRLLEVCWGRALDASEARWTFARPANSARPYMLSTRFLSVEHNRQLLVEVEWGAPGEARLELVDGNGQVVFATGQRRLRREQFAVFVDSGVTTLHCEISLPHGMGSNDSNVPAALSIAPLPDLDEARAAASHGRLLGDI